MASQVTSIIDFDHTYLKVTHENAVIFIRKEYVIVEVNTDNPEIINFFWHWYELNTGQRLFYIDFNIVTDPLTGSADELLSALRVMLISQHHFPVREITSDHTLVIEDAKRDIIVNSQNVVVITIPTNANVNFHLFEEIHFMPYGTGVVNFEAAIGVVLLSLNGDTSITGPYNCCYIRQIALNVWKLCGDITTYIDPDVQDFIDAAQITDEVIILALNVFVIGLKDDNLWSKFIAIHPLVGGTADAHKWNLVNPLDSDAAFRLTYGGALTHDANGITVGALGNARTKIIPNTHITLAGHSYHIYLRNNDMSGNKMAYGVTSGSNFHQINPPSATFTCLDGTTTLGDIGVVLAASTGLLSSVRTAADLHTLYRNAVSQGTSADTISAQVSGFDIWLGSRDNAGTPDFTSAYNIAFWAAESGTGLTAPEMTTFYNHVQTLQTNLSRQV